MIVETEKLRYVFGGFVDITEKHGNKQLKIFIPRNNGNDIIMWVAHMNTTGSGGSSIGAKFIGMRPELNRVYRLHGHRIIG